MKCYFAEWETVATVAYPCSGKTTVIAHSDRTAYGKAQRKVARALLLDPREVRVLTVTPTKEGEL